MVEFAIVTPILLLMIVGMVAVGLLILNRMQLQHAAFESAVAVARHPSGCSVADARVGQILGFRPDEISCSATGQLVTVRLAHGYPSILPIVPGRVEAVGRAALRDEEIPPEEVPAE